jgi:hypothetical protein
VTERGAESGQRQDDNGNTVEPYPGARYANRAAFEASEAPQERIQKLETALRALIIDANRLCDRQLGGSYEADCRRTLAQARAALR